MDKGATIQRMFSVARVRFSVICTKHKTLSLSPLCLHLQPESVSKFKIHYQTLSLSVVLFPLFTKRKKKKKTFGCRFRRHRPAMPDPTSPSTGVLPPSSTQAHMRMRSRNVKNKNEGRKKEGSRAV